MKREIILTADGSTSITIPQWNEGYHSKHGALQEANHVFIQQGLNRMTVKPLRILEIGFGTGLNALISCFEAAVRELPIIYTTVEAFPVSAQEWKAMNFAQFISHPNATDWYEQLHSCAWEQPHKLHAHFELTKKQLRFEQIDWEGQFDLIYYDAFGYDLQPELWTADLFGRMYKALDQQGILVTYAARSVIKRNMIAVGFRVEKHPGPPGKREMMVAFKD